jgi:hypothetical protein
MYNYYQQVGGNEAWKPVPTSAVETLDSPMFVTVLAVDKIVTDDMTKVERDKLKYIGPLYFDWDGASIDEVTPNVIKLVEKLEKLGVNPDQLQFYATGKKGYHCIIPPKLFLEKGSKAGVENLPLIYWEVAYKLAVDNLDFAVYSGRKGRMWRQPNVQRENGKYKVPVSYAELKEMTSEKYEELCSTQRPAIAPLPGTLCIDLAVLYGECSQKVKAMLAKRSKQRVTKLSPEMKFPSIDALMQNKGIKQGTGFHTLAMQLAIYANERGWEAGDLIERCKVLIDTHESDGSRYDTPGKRAEELRRMVDYTKGNPCYVFAAAPLKALLTHAAPDLDGLPSSTAEIDTLIEAPLEVEADGTLSDTPHEYDDLAGVVLNKFGVYAATEFGTKRISAVSFDNVRTLRSTDSGTISMVESDILVNGKLITRAPIELETFHSAGNFNKFAARFGHAFQGNDSNVRGMYLRVMEKSKATGNDNYACSREGLDVINIPNHEDERLRKPFLIWADGKGVVLEPRIAETGVNISFQGYPDPRGQFRSDLADAPKLVEWLNQDDNKEVMAQALENLFSCHAKNVTATTVGWYISCFYRMLFHKVYTKFPMLHVNGAAGSGKTEYNRSLLSFFYYNQEPKTLTPTSTTFAITFSASGSASIPLVVDEYKPHEMPPAMHDRLKLMFRDAYNCRDVQRGGGTRDSDDYRVLSSTMLSAPMAFIAEAMEDEAALMERVVLVTMSRPTPIQASKNLTKFIRFSQDKHVLAILGKYIAASIVNDYSVDALRKEFDPIVDGARKKYLLQEGDLETLNHLELQEKFSAKERTVFNFSVSKFGLKKLKDLLHEIYGSRFDEMLDEISKTTYDRMSDLNASTQAEWLKVLNAMVDMSTADETAPYKLRARTDYALISYGGQDCLEISLRSCYAKYRIYCRTVGTKALFNGETAFLHGVKDASALAAVGYTSGSLKVPGGSIVFNSEQLVQLGVRAFKS